MDRSDNPLASQWTVSVEAGINRLSLKAKALKLIGADNLGTPFLFFPKLCVQSE